MRYADQYKLLGELGQVLSRYDKAKLVKSLAAIQVLPENHSHQIRCETALAIALSFAGRSGKSPNSSDLKTILSKHLSKSSYFGCQEDPSENLFTENINFFGGTYTVYPGILQQGTFTLQSIIEAVYLIGDDRWFARLLYPSILGLLLISNEISKHLGHTRFMQGNIFPEGDVFVPSAGGLEYSIRGITLSNEEIVRVLNEKDIDLRWVEDFFISMDDSRFREPNPDVLLESPLIRNADQSVTVVATGILPALLHFINRKIEEHQLRSLVTKGIRDSIFQECLDSLPRLAHPILVGTDETPTEDHIREVFFHLDSDKLGHILIVVDPGIDYPQNYPFASHYRIDVGETLVQCREKAKAKFINDKGYKDVLTLVVPASIGRGIGVQIDVGPLDPDTVLMLFARDLWLLFHHGELDMLDLWKYSKARRVFRERFIVGAWDFLDEFCFYLDSDRSFYKDEVMPGSVISLMPWGNNFAYEVLKRRDCHAVYAPNPDREVVVVRGYYNDFVPVYLPHQLEKKFELVVEVLKCPVWVYGAKDTKEVSPDLRSFYKEMIECVAYWIWQMGSFLQENSVGSEERAIMIEVRLLEEAKWLSLPKEQQPNSEDSMVSMQSTEDGWVISISPSLLLPLSAKDNRGERIIVSKILEAFIPNVAKGNRDQAVDRIAPIGLKKKISILDAANQYSLIRTAMGHREVQRHDANAAIDNIVQEIDPKGELVDNVLSLNQKKAVIRNVVQVYFKKLDEAIAELDGKQLLSNLITQNEALINHRSLTHLWSPLRMECFSDMPSEVDRLRRDLPKINQSSLAVRLLIEYVSQKLPTGTEQLSGECLDRVMALMYQLTNYAMMYEDLSYGVIDHDIKLLPTGRIGIGKESRDGPLVPFWAEKSFELAERLHANRSREVKPEKEFTFLDLPTAAEAFIDEFGLTAEEVMQFFHSAISLAMKEDSDDGVAWLSLEECTQNLEQILEWESAKIEAAINNFSIPVPSNLKTEKEGKLWRFNRIYSMIRRPFVIFEDANGRKMVTWGFRQVEESLVNLFTLIENARLACKSRKMTSYLGEIGNKIGEEFNEEVFALLKPKYQVVHKKIDIKPGSPFFADKSYGDLDVLVVDTVKSEMILIDTKDISIGREPVEIAMEIRKFYEGDKPHVDMHSQRKKWVEGNLKKIEGHLGIESRPWCVKAIIVTSEEVPSRYFRKSVDVEVISYRTLKRTYMFGMDRD